MHTNAPGPPERYVLEDGSRRSEEIAKKSQIAPLNAIIIIIIIMIIIIIIIIIILKQKLRIRGRCKNFHGMTIIRLRRLSQHPA